MDASLDVALSAQLTLVRQLDTVARNVANATTAGYRADGVTFEAALSKAGRDGSVAFASVGEEYISRETGELTRTENPLDVAVEGDAWLAIQTPAGRVFTRDGRMQMLPNGELQTLGGFPILDVGGAPLLLNPDGGPPTIARDGMITQGGEQIGAVGLFTIDERAGLTRHGNSGVIPDRPAQPVLDFTATGVMQGFVEGSNVNPMLELTRMIQISRSFDSAADAVQQSESTLKEAIRTLGATS